MATKAQANAPKQQEQLASFLDVDHMDDDALLDAERALQEQMKKIADAKKDREANMLKRAFSDIDEVLKRHQQVINQQSLLAWLVENEYVVQPVAVAATATVGRRKINDADLLFSYQYTNEGGDRQQTLKFDAQSKTPAATSGAFKAYSAIKDKPFTELKEHFTKKFAEFWKTKDGEAWTEEMFPQVFKDMIKQEEEQAELDKAGQAATA